MSVGSKGGRPRKIDYEKRTSRVVCRLTESEKKEIKNKAKRQGLSESELLRSLILAPASKSDLSELYPILRSAKNVQWLLENENIRMDDSLIVHLKRLMKDINEVFDSL